MGAFKEAERDEMNHLDRKIDYGQEDDTCAIDKPSTEECKSELAPMEELLDRNAAWRASLRSSMKPKERTAIPRCAMNELNHYLGAVLGKADGFASWALLPTYPNLGDLLVDELLGQRGGGDAFHAFGTYIV